MSKKSNPLEILKPIRPVPNVRAQLDEFIEQKVAEIIGADQTGIFEPWFQRKAIAREIRRLQTVPQQRKWHNYFLEWGCLDCKKKDGRYAAEGMCATCYSRTKLRLQTILRFTEKERPDAAPFDLDRSTELARAAVRARSSSDLARRLTPPASSDSVVGDEDSLFVTAEIPPLEVETRAYITKAERRAHRAETLRQAVEQGLTAREIAERYDPDFVKNPEAATERIRVAIYRYVPPAVRERAKVRIAQRKQERSARREEIWREAKTLHDKGETWRAATQRLDPEGFAKDPKAAMARIITGSRRVPLVRDLTELARTALGKSRRER